MKNTIFVVIFLVVMASLIFAFRYNKAASSMQEELQRERYTRMTAEENLERAKEKLSSLQSQLTKYEKKSGTLELQVEEFTALTNDLQDRLDQATKRKEALEVKLQEENVTPTDQSVKTETVQGQN